MYSTSRSYFSYLCASVTSRICLSISPSLSLSPCLCFLPTLPHRPVSKSNQKAGESHELSPVAASLSSSSPIIGAFKHRTLAQKGTLYAFIFHSFLFFPTIPNNFEARESRLGVSHVCFYCVRWRARLLFCIFFPLFVTDATNEGVVPK